MSLDRLPGADVFKQTPRPVGDRDRPQWGGARRGGRRRIDDGDGRAFPHRLLDRGCKRQSGRAAAGDDDVEDGSGFGHVRRLLPVHCRADQKPHNGSWAAAPFSSPDSIFSRRCGAISESLTARPEAYTDGRAPSLFAIINSCLSVGTNPILSRWVPSPALRRLVSLRRL